MVAFETLSPLDKIINARSLAFYGASSRPQTMGSIILSSVLSEDYKGKVYPIHPKEKEVRGLKAYADPSLLPEVPDLAILILPTSVVCQSLEACGKAGIKRAIVVSGGFKEVGGEGVQLEEDLKAIGKHYGIRIVGPNCLGIANTHIGLNTTPMMLEGKPGFIGLVSQSGSFITQMFNYLANLGLGFSSAISVGNEADLDIVDCMNYYADCPDTKVIALYIEGIKRGREFVEAARRITRKKPVVAFYVGGSEAGRRAAFSHTGSLSGPDQLYQSAFRQAGIIRAHTITELFDFCWTLGTLTKPTGNRVVIQTHSGGPGASAADACSRCGLSLPALSEKTRKNLAPYMPHTASMANPVDLTFTQNQRDYFFEVPQVLLQEESLDFLLIYLLMPEKAMVTRMFTAGISDADADKMINDLVQSAIDTFAQLKEKFGKPIIGFTYRNLQEKLAKGFIERGIPVFQDADRAAKSLKAVVEYHRTRDTRNNQ